MKFRVLNGITASALLLVAQGIAIYFGGNVNAILLLSTLIIPTGVNLYFWQRQKDLKASNSLDADNAILSQDQSKPSQAADEQTELEATSDHKTAINFDELETAKKTIETIRDNASRVNAASVERVETMDGVIDKSMALKGSLQEIVDLTGSSLNQLGETDGKLTDIQKTVQDGLEQTKANVQTADKLKSAVTQFSAKFESIDTSPHKPTCSRSMQQLKQRVPVKQAVVSVSSHPR